MEGSGTEALSRMTGVEPDRYVSPSKAREVIEHALYPHTIYDSIDCIIEGGDRGVDTIAHRIAQRWEGPDAALPGQPAAGRAGGRDPQRVDAGADQAQPGARLPR